MLKMIHVKVLFPPLLILSISGMTIAFPLENNESNYDSFATNEVIGEFDNTILEVNDFNTGIPYHNVLQGTENTFNDVSDQTTEIERSQFLDNSNYKNDNELNKAKLGNLKHDEDNSKTEDDSIVDVSLDQATENVDEVIVDLTTDKERIDIAELNKQEFHSIESEVPTVISDENSSNISTISFGEEVDNIQVDGIKVLPRLQDLQSLQSSKDAETLDEKILLDFTTRPTDIDFSAEETTTRSTDLLNPPVRFPSGVNNFFTVLYADDYPALIRKLRGENLDNVENVLDKDVPRESLRFPTTNNDTVQILYSEEHPLFVKFLMHSEQEQLSKFNNDSDGISSDYDYTTLQDSEIENHTTVEAVDDDIHFISPNPFNEYIENLNSSKNSVFSETVLESEGDESTVFIENEYNFDETTPSLIVPSTYINGREFLEKSEMILENSSTVPNRMVTESNLDDFIQDNLLNDFHAREVQVDDQPYEENLMFYEKFGYPDLNSSGKNDEYQQRNLDSTIVYDSTTENTETSYFFSTISSDDLYLQQENESEVESTPITWGVHDLEDTIESTEHFGIEIEDSTTETHLTGPDNAITNTMDFSGIPFEFPTISKNTVHQLNAEKHTEKFPNEDKIQNMNYPEEIFSFDQNSLELSTTFSYFKDNDNFIHKSKGLLNTITEPIQDIPLTFPGATNSAVEIFLTEHNSEVIDKILTPVEISTTTEQFQSTELQVEQLNKIISETTTNSNLPTNLRDQSEIFKINLDLNVRNSLDITTNAPLTEPQNISQIFEQNVAVISQKSFIDSRNSIESLNSVQNLSSENVFSLEVLLPAVESVTFKVDRDQSIKDIEDKQLRLNETVEQNEKIYYQKVNPVKPSTTVSEDLNSSSIRIELEKIQDKIDNQEIVSTTFETIFNQTTGNLPIEKKINSKEILEIDAEYKTKNLKQALVASTNNLTKDIFNSTVSFGNESNAEITKVLRSKEIDESINEAIESINLPHPPLQTFRKSPPFDSIEEDISSEEIKLTHGISFPKRKSSKTVSTNAMVDSDESNSSEENDDDKVYFQQNSNSRIPLKNVYQGRSFQDDEGNQFLNFPESSSSFIETIQEEVLSVNTEHSIIKKPGAFDIIVTDGSVKSSEYTPNDLVDARSSSDEALVSSKVDSVAERNANSSESFQILEENKISTKSLTGILLEAAELTTELNHQISSFHSTDQEHNSFSETTFAILTSSGTDQMDNTDMDTARPSHDMTTLLTKSDTSLSVILMFCVLGIVIVLTLLVVSWYKIRNSGDSFDIQLEEQRHRKESDPETLSVTE